MNREEAEATVESYAALMAKAQAILDTSGPPWGFVGEWQFARLTFDGDTAIVIHPKADFYYDSITIEPKQAEFPADLLFMTDDELKAWRVKAKANYDREQKEAARKRAAEHSAAERAEYEKLKRKFEPQ